MVVAKETISRMIGMNETANEEKSNQKYSILRMRAKFYYFMTTLKQARPIETIDGKVSDEVDTSYEKQSTRTEKLYEQQKSSTDDL